MGRKSINDFYTVFHALSHEISGESSILQEDVQTRVYLWPGVGRADGGSECVLEGHFSMKWVPSSHIDTCTAQAGGGVFGGAGKTAPPTARAPGSPSVSI